MVGSNYDALEDGFGDKIIKYEQWEKVKQKSEKTGKESSYGISN